MKSAVALSGQCRALLLSALMAPVIGSAQSTVWRNDWLPQLQPTLWSTDFYDASYGPQLHSPVAISPDGDIILRTPSPSTLDDQFVRMTSTGVVRGRTNLANYGTTPEPSYAAMLANADGSAIVATQQGLALAKLDATGNAVWVDAISTSYLAALAGNAVAVQSCNSIAAVDAASGRLLWKRDVPYPYGQCAEAGITTDAQGNTYALFTGYMKPGDSTYDTRLLKLDMSGSVVWNQDWATTYGWPASLIAVGATRVYVNEKSSFSNADNSVRALDITTGLTAWTLAATKGLGMGGTPAELVIQRSDAAIQRIAEQDGSVRWTQTAFAPVPNSYAFVGSFAADGSGNHVLVDDVLLDSTTGAVLWTANLPANDAQNGPLIYFSSGWLANGSILFAGYPRVSGAPPVLQTVDASSGALQSIVPIAAALQGLLADATLADTQTIAAAALSPSATGVHVHARAVNTSDGTLRWENIDDSLALSPYLAHQSSVAAKGAITIVATDEQSVWAISFDLATGSRRWSVLLGGMPSPWFQSQNAEISEPIVDADGNIIVPFGANVGIYPPGGGYQMVTQLSVVKLRASDGSVMWRHDDQLFSTAGQIFPQTVTLVGADVVVNGVFAPPYTSSSLLDLSGQNGSVRWSSNALYTPTMNGSVTGIYPAHDGNLIALGVGGWVKIDAATGSTLWQNSWPPSSCTQLCMNGWGSVMLPNDDLLFAGQNASRMNFMLLPGHADASVIACRPDLDNPNLQQSFPEGLTFDASGSLWTSIYRRNLYHESVRYLAKFDPVSCTFARQQALSFFSRDPLLTSGWNKLLSAPSNERLLVRTSGNMPPAPATTGVALLDTTITANGNLSLKINTDRSSAAVGQAVNFHFTTTYQGDAAISGATLIADLPWVGRATNVNCKAQATNYCTLDSRADTIVARFDMNPGDQIEVTGQIIDSGSADPAVLSAIVVGPTGLNELDPSDNNARAAVGQSLFANGFE